MKQKRWRRTLIALVISIMMVGLAGAAYGDIMYTATNRGDNGDGKFIWQYDYLVTSNSPFTDFYIDFPYSNYDSLSTTDLISSAVLPSNPDWTISLTPIIPNSQNGIYSAVINSGIQSAGQTVSGFSVQFISAAPTDQTYSIYDNSGASPLIESGTTVATPEPTTWALMIVSLGTVLIVRRRMTHDTM